MIQLFNNLYYKNNITIILTDNVNIRLKPGTYIFNVILNEEPFNIKVMKNNMEINTYIHGLTVSFIDNVDLSVNKYIFYNNNKVIGCINVYPIIIDYDTIFELLKIMLLRIFVKL